MPLSYGFNYYGYEKGDASEKRFQALDKDEKHFYHNLLPFLLMFANVSYVSKDTIPEIVRRERYEINLLTVPKDKSKDDFYKWLEVYLEKFIGFEANVGNEPIKEFVARRHKRVLIEVSIFKTQKSIDKLWKKYLKEQYGVK